MVGYGSAFASLPMAAASSGSTFAWHDPDYDAPSPRGAGEDIEDSDPEELPALGAAAGAVLADFLVRLADISKLSPQSEVFPR